MKSFAIPLAFVTMVMVTQSYTKNCKDYHGPAFYELTGKVQKVGAYGATIVVDVKSTNCGVQGMYMESANSKVLSILLTAQSTDNDIKVYYQHSSHGTFDWNGEEIATQKLHAAEIIN